MRDKILRHISVWEKRCYRDGIPDEVPIEIFDMAPSYKAICIAIMKNDTNLLTLGFDKPKCQAYMEIKREELMRMGKIDTSQTSLLR